MSPTVEPYSGPAIAEHVRCSVPPPEAPFDLQAAISADHGLETWPADSVDSEDPEFDRVVAPSVTGNPHQHRPVRLYLAASR